MITKTLGCPSSTLREQLKTRNVERKNAGGDTRTKSEEMG